MAQDLELGRRDRERLFLQRVRPSVRDQEPDEMTGRTDRKVAKLQR